MKRTEKEIKRQVEGLKKYKEKLPEISKYGVNEWDKIDAQIAVLEDKKFVSEFWNEKLEDRDNHVLSAAQDAEDWLFGNILHDLF